MNHSKRIILTLTFALTAVAMTHAQVGKRQQVRKLVRQGNREYRADKRNESSVTYIKALQADSTYAPAIYNYATSLFPRQWLQVDQQNSKNMIGGLMRAAELEQNSQRKAQAYHNVGVLYQQAKDYKMAIEAYKEALRNNPNDDETRYNLAVCKKQQNQQQDQNQQGQDQDQNGEQQKQDQQQQQQQNQQQNENEQQQQQEPPMSKENAEQLLQAAIQQEKKTQDRLKDAQKQPQRRRIEKNW